MDKGAPLRILEPSIAGVQTLKTSQNRMYWFGRGFLGFIHFVTFLLSHGRR